MTQKGFTLLEVIVAIFILTVGAGASFALISQAIGSTSLIEQRLVAAYLSQEGLEIVKNLRDKALLEGRSWDYYLTEGNWQVDFTSQNLDPYNDTPLKINTVNGFYNYSSGDSTMFKRKIVISEKTADKMKILIQTQWQEKGRSHQLEVVEYITNWYAR